MTENRWAELRQVGFAALDHAAAVRAATDLLGLGPGFGDPLLAELNLADFTAPIGPHTYVEVLAPTVPEHSVARWLRRVGGASGWVLSTQVPSLDGVTERAKERGVRIAAQTQAMGHDVVQLHPRDVGVLLELDEFVPRTAWFWDDMETARAAQASRSAKVDDIVAVDVAAADPAAMAATWAAIIGIEAPTQTADGAALAFGRRTIRFVAAAGGRTGIVAVDLHATDRKHGTGLQGELCHTVIRFV
jgi:predicted nuclease with RNAse H fold